MRRKLVAANWKMHGSKAMMADFVPSLKLLSQQLKAIDIAICPPHVYLDSMQHLLKGSDIHCGAQDMSAYETGAYTGETAAAMLTDLSCQYVIVGHSERRQYHQESNELVATKAHLAVKHNIIPIICVGESLEQRNHNQTFAVIEAQINAIFSLEKSEKIMQNIALAYEPVWAIGTGQTASPEQAQEVHAFIRKLLAQIDATAATTVRIIYGGSVKASNAKALFVMPDIDGGLIGGASLNINEFTEICRCSL